MSAPKIITVARVGAPHGIKGLLKVQPFLEDPQSLLKFKQFYLQYPKQAWQVAPPFTFTKKSQNFFVHFQSVDQPELAGQKFTHALLGVLREELPRLGAGQYYWEDLQGLAVVNQAGQDLGSVDHLFATPAHDILVVKRGQEELLIPYITGRFILEVDLVQGVVRVDWE